MSMQDPNESERAIERYAEAVRRERASKVRLADAIEEERLAGLTRKDCWRQVSGFIRAGTIKPGIYRLSDRNRGLSEGILISGTEDYPDLFDMYR